MQERLWDRRNFFLLEIAELYLSAPRGSANSNGSEMEEEVAMYIGSAKIGMVSVSLLSG